MQINQVTLPCHDYDTSVAFYRALGFVLIVDAPPRYARFEAPDGTGATLSLHLAEADTQPHPWSVVYIDHPSAEALDAHVADLSAHGITILSGPRDESWGWREARILDPTGNQVCLMYAGDNRRFPPWRVGDSTCPN